MLPRALAPVVLCASAFWPLRALACMNSMDSSAVFLDSRSIFPSFTVWTDVFVWAVGAVFLNRVVFVNVRAPVTPDGQPAPAPAPFRKAFFLLVGACLVLVLAAVSAGGPLLNLSAQHDMSKCAMNGVLLLLLAASPMGAFLLHSALFQRVSQWLFGGDKTVTIVTLVVSSVVLSLGVDFVRAWLFVPSLCGDALRLVPSAEY
jgi:hypothetical protein